MIDLTVRQAIQKAYGWLPEGWQIMFLRTTDGTELNAFGVTDGTTDYEWYFEGLHDRAEGTWVPVCDKLMCYGPDLSDERAEGFLGSLGDRFDMVVKAEMYDWLRKNLTEMTAKCARLEEEIQELKRQGESNG